MFIAQRNGAVQFLFVVILGILVSACGGGGGPVVGADGARNSAGISLALKAPAQFQKPFCVRIEISAADFATMTSDRAYPAGTQVIETVVPNIPVGTNRTVEMGIFESGACASLASADWFGRATGVEIRNSEVTIVNLTLGRGKLDGIGSVVIRGDRADEVIRLHGEVVTKDSTPIAGVQCTISETGSPIGVVTTGGGTPDLGVFDTDIAVASTTNQVMLECSHPGYKTTTKAADRVADAADPRKATFIATVIMEEGVGVSVVESTNTRLAFRVSVPAPRLVKVDTAAGEFSRIDNTTNAYDVRGGGTDNFSQPETPTLTLYVALPAGAEGADISITPEGEPSTMVARLYPVQKPMRDPAGANPGEAPPKDDESFKFDPSLYARGVASALKPVSLRPVGGDADVNIYELRLDLVDYDPTKGALTLYPSFMVDVRYAGECFFRERVAEGLSMDAVDQIQEREAMLLRNVVLNKNLFTRYTCIDIFRPIFFGARLVIITPPAFVTAANNLATHKIARGISTRVVTTDTISPAGAVTALAIRDYLANAYNNWWIRPKWVLFMGDAEFIPTQYGANNSWDSAKNAGDIYYGQVAPGATDLSNSVFGMGRFPVDTVAQAQAIVDKIIDFENNPPSVGLFFDNSYYFTEAFASQFQDDDLNNQDDRWFAETSEHIRDYQLTQDMSVGRIYSAPAASNPTLWHDGGAVPAYLRKPGFAWNGSTADIIGAFNAGRSIVMHRDHGWWWGWGTPQFSTTDLGSIAITGREFPVVFSVNCASGIFDNETVDLPANKVGGGYGPSTTSVYWAETFIRKSDGAIGVIGDTRSSSTTLNNDMAKGLFDAIWPGYLAYGGATPIKKLGDVLNHAKAYVNSLGYSAADRRQEIKIYNLMGDPTVEVKARAPRPSIFGEIIRRANVLEIPVIFPPSPCLSCPFTALEPVVVVAQSPVGEMVARGVVKGGTAILDLGNYTGDVQLTASGTDLVPAHAEVKGVAETPR